MAKKKQEIILESLSDIDFKKEPDIELAQSVIEPSVPKAPPPASIKVSSHRQKKEVEAAPSEPAAPNKQARGTLAPDNKVRATFNVEADLHKAMKDYSYHEEVNMVDYIFEHLVKPDLAAKGYYPPKKKKR